VLIADDRREVRDGLALACSLAEDLDVVGEAATGDTAIARTEQLRPDVVLLDINMPVLDGLAAVPHIASHARVVMLTLHDSAEKVSAAVHAGATGYLVHGHFTPVELAGAIRRAHRGESPLSAVAAAHVLRAVRDRPDQGSSRVHAQETFDLTARERELIELMARGRTNAEISAELYVSAKTVKNHINRIFAKLGVRHRSEAVARWLGTAEGHR
jgi:DNA-binding NarL/FixJ family response regulator